MTREEIFGKVRTILVDALAVDVANLMNRVGAQVGIGEGRPDSKNSAGMGWGLFSIETKTQEKRDAA